MTDPSRVSRILVLTSCTGEKAVEHPRALTLEDFRRGPEHVRRRERELETHLTPAEVLYTGRHHRLLMRGVRALRGASPNLELDLSIVSAGYGLVSSARHLAPYEATFQGMPRAEIQAWAERLQVPMEVACFLGRPYDLAIVALGEDYLDACRLDLVESLGGHVLVFAGTQAARRLPSRSGLFVATLSRDDAKRFPGGLIGIKGELTARLLELIATEPSTLDRIRSVGGAVLPLLEREATRALSARAPRRPIEPERDRPIDIPTWWWEQPHRQTLCYFIPEWDDLVDAGYDFAADESPSGAWSREAYAHEIYPVPNYDGILVSRSVMDKSSFSRERVERLGVHRHLRVPKAFPVMGDCGAFSYITDDVPPYSTGEVLDYYTRLGFDLGVSVDHLIVSEFMEQRASRYGLTIQNAEDFLREHRACGPEWEPVGAIQGWDRPSYVSAARAYVAMGYRYIALGGLVRSTTREILAILADVRAVIPPETRVHLFGIARLEAIPDFARHGASSLDSASMLRKAWLGSTRNYLSERGWYAAVRIPQVEGNHRVRRLVEDGVCTLEQVQHLERDCLIGIRRHAAGEGRPSMSLLDLLVEYDTLTAGEHRGIRDRLYRTLADRPWESCPCAVCAAISVDVIIFRGNNRNRRRGFHNTTVFYDLMKRELTGERFSWLARPHEDDAGVVQGNLFALHADSLQLASQPEPGSATG